MEEKLPKKFAAILIFILLVYLIRFSTFLLPPKNVFHLLSLTIFLISIVSTIRKKAWGFYATLILLLVLPFLSFILYIPKILSLPSSYGISVTTQGVKLSFGPSVQILATALGSIILIFIYLFIFRFLILNKSYFIPQEEVEVQPYIECPTCGEIAIFIKPYNKYFCNECKKFIKAEIKKSRNILPLVEGIGISLAYITCITIAFLY
ncbi:hypothetical protein DRN63_01420 [Nanoarchaeota archaeon]|nr:MAG: hypothetical protein DRN63_01420 [Nanoarchaeota archaeon]